MINQSLSINQVNHSSDKWLAELAGRYQEPGGGAEV